MVLRGSSGADQLFEEERVEEVRRLFFRGALRAALVEEVHTFVVSHLQQPHVTIDRFVEQPFPGPHSVNMLSKNRHRATAFAGG